MVETVAFLFLALLLDRFLLDASRFRAIDPHPFWLIVLLITVQYGTAEGIAAAVCASLAFLAGHIPPQSLGEDLHTWLRHQFSLPVLWFVAAFFLGQISTRLRQDRDRLAAELVEGKERETLLARSLAETTTLKDALEETVAGQQKTLSKVVAGARALAQPNGPEVLLGIKDLVRSVLDPQSFSLSLVTDGKIVPSYTVGWPNDAAFPPSIETDSALYQALVHDRRMLAVIRRSDEQVLGEQGVLAGPLISPDTNEVFGILKIERLRFGDLTPSTIHAFSVLCEWIGEAYAKACRLDARMSVLPVGAREPIGE